MKKYAIIVAGGSGTRMGTDIPKQFLELNGLTILEHTILKFHHICDEIVIVLPEIHFSLWQKLQKSEEFNCKVHIVAGGNTRFQSVKNGLQVLPNDGLVAVHDAVRPFVNTSIIENAFLTCEQKGNAVVAIPLNDSIREVVDNKSIAKNRANYRLIQTPQCFNLAQLKTAYQTPELSTFTDDASVFEHAGYEIHLVEGNFTNIKITTPSDLLLGKVFLENEM